MIDILLIMQAWPFSKIGQKISKHKKNNDQIMTFNLLNIEIIVSNFTFYIGRLIKGSWIRKKLYSLNHRATIIDLCPWRSVYLCDLQMSIVKDISVDSIRSELWKVEH